MNCLKKNITSHSLFSQISMSVVKDFITVMVMLLVRIQMEALFAPVTLASQAVE